jgi:hypothetical protein
MKKSEEVRGPKLQDIVAELLSCSLDSGVSLALKTQTPQM